MVINLGSYKKDSAMLEKLKQLFSRWQIQLLVAAIMAFNVVVPVLIYLEIQASEAGQEVQGIQMWEWAVLWCALSALGIIFPFWLFFQLKARKKALSQLKH